MHNLRVMAHTRPGALPMPANRQVSALTKPNVFERWNEDAAGIRAVAMGDNVITMFDAIGADYWNGGGITAKSVSAQLRAIGDQPVEVQINSPGGDMFEGIAIYNVLREHPQDVTIKIMGMAASAASIIAMAGDTVEIGTASFIMIHNCWVVAMGNQFDLRDVADSLAPFDQAMTALYAERSGQTPEDVATWMQAETFMSGAMAIERGFADAPLAADQMEVDEQAQASDRRVNDVRAMEISLMATGDSRAQARAKIHKIRGTTDSAPEASTTDSADEKNLLGQLAGLLAMFQS